MPSIEREASREGDERLRHQHSGSLDSGRLIIPMWDSSDPERAPPPLPLNPSSPSLSTSRPNTSSAIASAHAALTEKARENAYIANVSPKRADTSPERSLIKEAAHKRMQSIQTGNVRDLSNLIEGGNLLTSPTKSPEKKENRPITPQTSRDLVLDRRSMENVPIRSESPTPTGRETPSLRPSLRKPQQNILGGNDSPQSATMMALQNMSAKELDSPLSNITNGSTALVRSPQSFDAISSQILSLTSIATNLQREMAQLSRRSKDNATDLVSLKEATNARDEDIRKSLRDLVSNLSDSGSRASSIAYGGNGLFIDNKPHVSASPGGSKPFSLPRIPSPNSFAASMDRESTASPFAYASDNAVSVALLEKILREMGTREGQDLLITRIVEVANRLSTDGVTNNTKLEQLIKLVKDELYSEKRASTTDSRGEKQKSRGLNSSFDEAPRLELDFDKPQSESMVSRVGNLLGNERPQHSSGSKSSDVATRDVFKVIQTVKDSVAQGGGLTAEVKALVRELRGEVLGMGRETARKLDEALAGKMEDANEKIDKETLAHIVNGGIEDLKEYMVRVASENHQRLDSSAASRSIEDTQKIHDAVGAAIGEIRQLHVLSERSQDATLEKDDIIEAVREAWEDYKPDIELQHFGLEREELLTCLREGMQEYSSADRGSTVVGANRDEVFEAIVEGLKHFNPPKIETQATLSRDEIIDAVRESLEEFDFPAAQSTLSRNTEFSREDILDAVREGLKDFELKPQQQIDSQEITNPALTKDDMYDAIRMSLSEMPGVIGESGTGTHGRLNEIMEILQTEFKAVSDEAKQNVAANGRDTEQVLDATKDGFERLRQDIESYVDKAADISTKDELFEAIDANFDRLKLDLESVMSIGSTSPLEAIKTELERMRDSMATAVVPGSSSNDKDEIIMALRDGIDNIRADIDRPKGGNESILSGTGEILDALHDGLTNLRVEVEKVGNKPVDMTVNYEILDTLKSGLEGLRVDIDALRESNESDRELGPVGGGAMISADESLKRNDIENLEILITQLRIKVEAMEAMPPPPPAATTSESLFREDFAKMEEVIRSIQDSISEISLKSHSSADEAIKKDDFGALETLLRNTKAKLDEMDPEQAVKKEQLDGVELIVRETRDTINLVMTQIDETSRKEDVSIVEALMKEVLVAMEAIKERSLSDEAVNDLPTKNDFEAVEAICLDVKGQLEKLAISASKDDVMAVADMVKEVQERVDLHADTTIKSFEERQAELVGVGERVLEVKAFMEEFKEAMREKFDDGSMAVTALGKVLEGLEETISQNGGVSEDIKVLFDTMKQEFERSNAGVVGAKLESDEKFQKTWDTLDQKLGENFGDLMAKYDQAQVVAEAAATLSQERSRDTEVAVQSTKAVAEELKILIDTLGPTMTESVEKMDEASKTVFLRVDDTYSKVESTHAESQSEHEATRGQVGKAIAAVESIHGNVSEYHPKILSLLNDVLLTVGQHFEHSKSSSTTIQDKIAEIPPPQPAPSIPLLKETPAAEEPKHSQMHEKLDKLVDHIQESEKSFAQLEVVEKIHQTVIQTATEISELVSLQTRRITEDHDDKEKAAADASIALEKRQAQKESVEATIVSLREEEELLKASVARMKADQDALALQKMRLAADVSSLETALKIRREELHNIEDRAEALERRILEGVIDHSRALLISKPSKGRDAMNLKRVTSNAKSATGSIFSTTNTASKAKNATQSAIDMALNGKRAVNFKPANLSSNGGSRRNFSLNQIASNIPGGTTAGNFKRSHSVKNPSDKMVLRKSSWGGDISRRNYGYGELNKENLAFKESEEQDDTEVDDVSESGTLRRTSQGTSAFTGTESYDDASTGYYSDSDVTEAEHKAAPVVLYEEAPEQA